MPEARVAAFARESGCTARVFVIGKAPEPEIVVALVHAAISSPNATRSIASLFMHHV
jgi:hypothetical protein